MKKIACGWEFVACLCEIKVRGYFLEFVKRFLYIVKRILYIPVHYPIHESKNHEKRAILRAFKRF
ncbi:hypothetical protein LS73_002675 [Helicobacter muridarum]|uniref:Uncharacterized protein n=1 Tax=Helicobacter muridarum TaxID=216 RepID=A0A4U8TL60_9HELI|nr:hypothetical protein LS73_004810 [Helicobacter muridarum]TLE01192.1 hypothetical protein LS73_002675 [Helicobacter muridarum]